MEQSRVGGPEGDLGVAVEELGKAASSLGIAAKLLEGAATKRPEVKLLGEEALDVLARVNAERDTLGLGSEG